MFLLQDMLWPTLGILFWFHENLIIDYSSQTYVKKTVLFNLEKNYVYPLEGKMSADMR